MVSRGVGARARTVLGPLVALLTLLGFAWMHVVAVTDPGTAQHHRVPAAAVVADGTAPEAGDHAPHGHREGPAGHGEGSAGHGEGSAGLGEGPDGHAVMVGCLLALTGVAAWALRRRPSAVRRLLSRRRTRATPRLPAASWSVPARGCGPPRIALCVLRV